jgi:signal transduction histidine kinase
MDCTDRLQLTHDSTLAHLPFHDFRVHMETPGHEVAAELERRGRLPGVIVRLDDATATVISRRAFFQHMSRGFSREIYLRLPIWVLLEALPQEVLRLPASTRISEAAGAALQRPQELVYEPVLVESADGQPHLLDAYDLLLAQAELLALANGVIQRQKEAAEAANRALKEAQTALVQSEKLASLGQLAAGLAHEFNNPIAFVSNNLAVLQREMHDLLRLLDVYGQAREALARANPALAAQAARVEEDIDLPYTRESLDRQFRSSLDGVRRVRDIVRNFCDFARLDQAAVGEICLNTALRTTLEILHHEFRRKDLKLQTQLEKHPPVTGHPEKINQVFLNLLLNAVQACAPGGVIQVRTRPEPGGGASADVEDDGCGIPAEHLPRIFEPFFTTKPVGQGRGLGLSVSYGIVRDHGGAIEVESTPGRGSLVRVRFPARPPQGL